MKLTKYLMLALVCTGFSFFAHWWFTGTSIWIIVAAAFWGLVFFTPLIFEAVPAVIDANRQAAQESLHGVHYLFDNVPVRVMYSEGKVWLPTKDVHTALGLKLAKQDLRRLMAGKRHVIIPGTHTVGIAEDHLSGFVFATRAGEASRFMIWFEREVQKPIHNKVAQGIRVPESVD